MDCEEGPSLLPKPGLGVPWAAQLRRGGLEQGTRALPGPARRGAQALGHAQQLAGPHAIPTITETQSTLVHTFPEMVVVVGGGWKFFFLPLFFQNLLEQRRRKGSCMQPGESSQTDAGGTSS